MKRFTIAFLAAYIFLFVWGWLINGVLLKEYLCRIGFYAVQTVPGKLIFYGSIGSIIEMVIVGAMVGAIYKPASAGTS